MLFFLNNDYGVFRFDDLDAQLHLLQFNSFTIISLDVRLQITFELFNALVDIHFAFLFSS